MGSGKPRIGPQPLIPGVTSGQSLRLSESPSSRGQHVGSGLHAVPSLPGWFVLWPGNQSQFFRDNKSPSCTCKTDSTARSAGPVPRSWVSPDRFGPEQGPAPASQPGTERPASQSTAGTRKAVALTGGGCPSRPGVGTGQSGDILWGSDPWPKDWWLGCQLAAASLTACCSELRNRAGARTQRGSAASSVCLGGGLAHHSGRG